MNSRRAVGCGRRVFLRMLALAAAGLPAAGLSVEDRPARRMAAVLALDDRVVGRMARWAG
jgi:hypothetical protein